MGDVFDPKFRRSAECVRVGRDRHEFDEAAERVGAVECALRSAQNLDTREIGGVDVRSQDRAVGESCRRAEWSLVNVGGDGRTDATRIDTPEYNPRIAGLAFHDVRAWDPGQIVGQTLRMSVFQRLPGNDGHRLRDIDQCLRALLRRDDDRILIGRGPIGPRRGRTGRCGCILRVSLNSAGGR